MPERIPPIFPFTVPVKGPTELTFPKSNAERCEFRESGNPMLQVLADAYVACLRAGLRK